jgi:hypothetical protein
VLIRLQHVGSSTAEELRHRGDDARTFDAGEQQAGAPSNRAEPRSDLAAAHELVPVAAVGSVISLLPGWLGASSVAWSVPRPAGAPERVRLEPARPAASPAGTTSSRGPPVCNRCTTCSRRLRDDRDARPRSPGSPALLRLGHHDSRHISHPGPRIGARAAVKVGLCERTECEHGEALRLIEEQRGSAVWERAAISGLGSPRPRTSRSAALRRDPLQRGPEWGRFRTLNWTLNPESRPQRERRAARRRAQNPAISRQKREVARPGIEPGDTTIFWQSRKPR